MKPNIILIGPPGSGKSSIGKMLVQRLGYNFISAGDLLRKEVDSKSKLGKEIKALIDNGEMVSDNIIVKLIENEVGKNGEKPIAIDGFPRRKSQVNKLLNILNYNIVVKFNDSDHLVTDRLLHRLMCDKCGQTSLFSTWVIQNVISKCECGGTMYTRKDDNIKSIYNRLKVYHKNIGGILEAFGTHKQRLLFQEMDDNFSLTDKYIVILEAILEKMEM